MALAPGVPRPAVDGPLIWADSCTPEDGRLYVSDEPFTGTIVTRTGEGVSGSATVELQSCVDGVLGVPFVDRIHGIDLDVCVIFEDHHYAVGLPPEATSAIQFDIDVVYLWSARSESPKGLSFWRNGGLRGLSGMHATTSDGRQGYCSWQWDHAGSLTRAQCQIWEPEARIPGAFQGRPLASSEARFDSNGHVEYVDMKGDFLDQFVPLLVEEDWWVLQSAEELFDLEVGASMRIPNAPELEDRILAEAPRWLANLRHIVLSHDFSADFAEQLIAACHLESIEIDSLGGRKSWPRFVEGDEARLLDLARRFVASDRSRRAEIDHCVITSIDTDLHRLAQDRYRGSIIFDQRMEYLVALDAPFPRDVYLELMRASPKLEFVRIPARSLHDRTESLSAIESLHPQAVFDYGQADSPTERAMKDWVRSRES